MGVSKNRGKTPQIIHFNRVFHYKSSILGFFPLFLETPIKKTYIFHPHFQDSRVGLGRLPPNRKERSEKQLLKLRQAVTEIQPGESQGIFRRISDGTRTNGFR